MVGMDGNDEIVAGTIIMRKGENLRWSSTA